MKNGTYEYKQSITNSSYRVVVCKGVIKLYELTSVNGGVKTYDYKGIKSAKEMEMYELVKEVKMDNKWNLEYWTGGRRQATIMSGVNYGMAQGKRTELMRTTHKVGLLTIVRAEM